MKILVVDDDVGIVKTTGDILRLKGYEPIIALSGEEALEKVRQEIPDCVLMDIKMPGISGVEALKVMHELAPSLPVILASAYATNDIFRSAQRLGAYAVLSKPFDFQVLISFLGLLKKQESILLVDDDSAYCKSLREMLESRGYRVATQWQPSLVLGDMEKQYYLAVLIDHTLSEATGMNLFRWIRYKYPTKPIIMMGGERQAIGETIEKCLAAGAYSCLHKPIDPDELTRLIEEIRIKKLQDLLTSK